MADKPQEHRYTGLDRRGPGVALGAVAPVPPALPGKSRHGAITQRLGRFSNYKEWAAKVRQNWLG